MIAEENLGKLIITKEDFMYALIGQSDLGCLERSSLEDLQLKGIDVGGARRS